jgi:tetratricopeptide (TPR) repeat protein
MTAKSMFTQKLLLVTLSLFVALPGASAANKESQERAAKKACLTGDATKGTDILADLYIDSNDPVYLFNQGRCFEQNNRYEEAVSRFREYLRKADNASEAEKIDAQKHIDACQALLGKNSAGSTIDPPVAPASTPAVTPESSPPVSATATRTDPVVLVQPASTNEPGTAGSALRITGVVSVAVGGAALLAGVALNLKSNGMVDDLRQRYNKDDDSSHKSYKTLSQVGYGVGAALIAGGAILYYLGQTAGDSAKVTLTPAFAAGSAGAVLTGAF